MPIRATPGTQETIAGIFRLLQELQNSLFVVALVLNIGAIIMPLLTFQIAALINLQQKSRTAHCATERSG